MKAAIGAGLWLGLLLACTALPAEAPDPEALRLAIEDLCATFPEAYSAGPAYLDQLDTLQGTGDHAGLLQLQREALLDNPLLRFDRLLIIKRSDNQLGLVQNWQSNSCLPRLGFDNEIALLSGPFTEPVLTTLHRPTRKVFVGDLNLDFDATRLLFSSVDRAGRWQIFEISTSGGEALPLTLIAEPDVDNYEGCYLPDGNIIFASTAPFVGVPCVTGSSHVSNLYRYDRDTGAIRRLTFEQDHNWCPTVLPNGRILYLRWEYSDIPHFASRILFHMNPDGTGQMEYYGSNSYWPNAMFYARPLPGSSTRFTAIVGGHHDVPRMGELVLFDTAKGRHETSGVIQRIPGRGKPVEPLILDGLVENSWPKFLHPWPLSEKHFLVAAKPTPESNWGLYLADTFDNLVLIKEEPGYVLFEPIPLVPRPVPPVIPSRVQTDRTDAMVYMADVYQGPGLEGVPQGVVKQLRLFTYHFAYHGMGGQVNRVGLDGPWDIKRVIGTVPVEPDGSAYFRVPANTPISVQPLDEEGKAIQLMRSWMTAMPGEVLSCVGCHEAQNSTPPVRESLASRRMPSEIDAWYGPTRGFSFIREVQPVLDQYCIRCHDGVVREDGLTICDLRDQPPVHPEAGDAAYRDGTKFTPAYLALRRYVRAPTMESDMHLLPPYEFHADTTELIQLLKKGHHRVQMTREAWDRLITWIDLGAPAHGTWHEIVGPEKTFHQRDRRRAMQALYAPGADDDPEAIPHAAILQEAETIHTGGIPTLAGERPAAPALAPALEEPLPVRHIDLGNGVSLELTLIPAGNFYMGDPEGYPDEWPVHYQKIEEPFWMGRLEVSNAQYARFDPEHDSRLEHGDFLQFSVEERGYPLNAPDQPVARVSWINAMAFCEWLSGLTGEAFTLPTEAQWEYACRAGANGPLWYGGTGDDFAPYANLADENLERVDDFMPWRLPAGAVMRWRPAMASVNDGHRVSALIGTYQPNPWGLYDMHGNVAEWTRSDYLQYPYIQGDAREADDPATRKVVRGGSWYDRPIRARASARREYWPWQPVFDVGFRIVSPSNTSQEMAALAANNQ